MLSKRPEPDVARRRALLQRAQKEYDFILGLAARMPFKVCVWWWWWW